jgi:hypothetical protein
MTVEEERGTGAPASSNLGVTLLRVAWLAILLGIGMEILLLLLSAGFGDLLGLGPIVADLIKNVSWAMFVCVGLAVGMAATQARAPVMGLLGVLAAPSAFEISRVLHKGTLEIFAVSGTGSGDLSPFLVALIKGLEYGCLGVLVGWLGRRPWGGAVAHTAAGLAVGLLFGGAIVALTLASNPEMPAADLVSRGVNEILFPVGCALILFSAATLGKRVATPG